MPVTSALNNLVGLCSFLCLSLTDYKVVTAVGYLVFNVLFLRFYLASIKPLTVMLDIKRLILRAEFKMLEVFLVSLSGSYNCHFRFSCIAPFFYFDPLAFF